MDTEHKKSVTLKSSGTQNTTTEATTPFQCSCNASARFIPLYRFNEHGAHAQIVVGPGHGGAIMCASCRQMYRWVPPTEEGAHDGGWERDSTLEDLIRLVGD